MVTILFCDLADFTSASEQVDPEDVRARIRPYHSMLRKQIERYGGTVEKFIGDAVMAVFGAPVVHEDDAERAVRAGLRISEAIEELNQETPELELRFRIGINTGEAVVALGARPEQGEGLVTGDVVNTASRLQSAAPVGRIVVGEATHRATQDIFDYEALEPVTVKGKAKSLPVWQVSSARGRLGTDVATVHATPLVGRELELRLLQDTFERTVKDRSVQLVTIVGEPGVGKSRMVAELLRFVDDQPELVVWRQGRCLSYGDGVTFWALGEIVKAEAGILDTDSPEVAASKLNLAIPEELQDREWLRQRLAPLVGLEASSPAEREEGFTAWRRFLESIAERHPAVFVFEDLHWADEAMLAFVEHLVEWSEGVPMLVLATARPEIYERGPAWTGGKRNVATINLSRLGDTETARLISVLLKSAVIPAEVQALILERAGGNPLYAEEFVRLLRDRGLLVTKGRTLSLAEDVEIPLPEGLQSLIAARLDTLSPDRKAMLQDAAVVGKVFWLGALVEMGGVDRRNVSDVMHELAKKELIRSARVSSMAGDAEYSFSHILIKDVAYGQIPRAARIEKHRRAAAWIESVAGERVEDLADVLAYHYTAARSLALATGHAQTAQELEPPALRFLKLAGDRALGLNAVKAEENLARALELAPKGHPRRPELLVRWATAARDVGHHTEAVRALEEAVAGFRDQNEVLAEAHALIVLANVLWHLGDPRPREMAAKAVALLGSVEPGPELVAAYAETIRLEALGGELSHAIELAEATIALADRLGLEKPAKALGYRGLSRCALGDIGGLDDLSGALAATIERGEGREAGVWYSNLAVARWASEGPAAGQATFRQGIDFVERRGLAEVVLLLSAESPYYLVDLGSWDEVLQSGRSLAEQLEKSGSLVFLCDLRISIARVLSMRGREDEALPLAEWALGTARQSKGLASDRILRALVCAARVNFVSGQLERSRELLVEFEHRRNILEFTIHTLIPDAVRVAIAVGDAALAERLMIGMEVDTPYANNALCASRAMLAEAHQELENAMRLYAEAAERWERMSAMPERGLALLGEGRCLLALGRSAQASEPLWKARDIFAQLGAKLALAEAEALLRKVTALSS